MKTNINEQDETRNFNYNNLISNIPYNLKQQQDVMTGKQEKLQCHNNAFNTAITVRLLQVSLIANVPTVNETVQLAIRAAADSESRNFPRMSPSRKM